MSSAFNIPEGFVLVPREPTFAMKRAGWAERNDDLSASIYKAMIAAAPTPTQVAEAPKAVPQAVVGEASELFGEQRVPEAVLCLECNGDGEVLGSRSWLACATCHGSGRTDVLGKYKPGCCRTAANLKPEFAILSLTPSPAPSAAPQEADALREDAERLDWIERHVCDVSRLGDSARTLRISWNNGADYAFVGPRYNANWREAIDAARAALTQHQPQQGEQHE